MAEVMKRTTVLVTLLLTSATAAGCMVGTEEEGGNPPDDFAAEFDVPEPDTLATRNPAPGDAYSACIDWCYDMLYECYGMYRDPDTQQKWCKDYVYPRCVNYCGEKYPQR
jgi:hypothetical protein